jgi:hypothetical protein
MIMTATVAIASVDARLIFLHRASDRLILFEAGEMTLDEAVDGLIEPCECCREILDRWECASRKRRSRR